MGLSTASSSSRPAKAIQISGACGIDGGPSSGSSGARFMWSGLSLTGIPPIGIVRGLRRPFEKGVGTSYFPGNHRAAAPSLGAEAATTAEARGEATLRHCERSDNDDRSRRPLIALPEGCRRRLSGSGKIHRLRE